MEYKTAQDGVNILDAKTQQTSHNVPSIHGYNSKRDGKEFHLHDLVMSVGMSQCQLSQKKQANIQNEYLYRGPTYIDK